ncbi:MAG: ABC transporter substrate-binding protein, partial [Clostridia bacterium]|nr:ABC transporter substrate-binding protein [Clostridia bacterium]
MKKLIALLLVLCTVLPIASCHGTEDSVAFSVPESFDTSREYEISFWAKNDTNIAQVNIYKQAIADFQELYPNITVNL